jgi:lipoprotein-releasing system ATP-binding protein
MSRQNKENTTQKNPTLPPDLILKASGLHKAFYDPAKIEILSGVSLEVHRGETIAITGASGEGKSTLLHILGTLESPCSGSLEIVGQKVTKGSAARIRNLHIGFIFQSFHLLEDYTTIENILMPARIARKETNPESESYKHAEALLKKVGLSDRAQFHTKLLSGGEKQRVAIARALCNDPDIILADEPSGNLDHSNSAQIHRLLLDLASEQHKVLIIVTHDRELAALCKRHYLLKNGQLLAQS